MRRRQTFKAEIPKIWLMTDERFGDGLIAAIRRLPIHSGVIFRHYALSPVERQKLFAKVARICNQRGHLLLLAAGHEQQAMRWHADGAHNARQIALNRSPLLRSCAVHNNRELAIAQRAHADIIFISPVFSTRSHPEARPIGAQALTRLAERYGEAKVIALGGMTRAKFAMLGNKHIHGWAAIDAFKKSGFLKLPEN
jgi:thiamine-phosphate pyrophosphorylase